MTSYASKVAIFVYHQGQKFHTKDINSIKNISKLKESLCKIHVGCKFFVKVINPKDEHQDIEVYAKSNYNGHNS